MIKFTAATPEGMILGLGITRGNVQNLMKGRPIQVLLKDVGLEKLDGSVVIFYGETEESIVADLKQAGFMTDETQIQVDLRKGVDHHPPPPPAGASK